MIGGICNSALSPREILYQAVTNRVSRGKNYWGPHRLWLLNPSGVLPENIFLLRFFDNRRRRVASTCDIARRRNDALTAACSLLPIFLPGTQHLAASTFFQPATRTPNRGA
jgi:hypothetical protein